MHSLPPPRRSGLAWRKLSKGVYADGPSALDPIETDLAAYYDLSDPEVRAGVWQAVVGTGVPPTLHEIVLRYEAKAARHMSGNRRGAGGRPGAMRPNATPVRAQSPRR